MRAGLLPIFGFVGNQRGDGAAIAMAERCGAGAGGDLLRDFRADAENPRAGLGAYRLAGFAGGTGSGRSGEACDGRYFPDRDLYYLGQGDRVGACGACLGALPVHRLHIAFADRRDFQRKTGQSLKLFPL